MTAVGTGELAAPLSMDESNGYFRLEAMEPGDADGDGLADVEEGSFLGTNPLVADTDGDGLSDGAEVFRTFTDPLTPNPQGGTIEGVVRTDPNGDGDLADGLPVAGAVVYLDLDYNGSRGDEEPAATTDEAGRHVFTHLRPGVYHVRQELPAATVQTRPDGGASPIPDRVPDEVVAYVHSDQGALPVPYGRAADAWKGLNTIIFPVTPQPVPPTLVTKPIGERARLPAIGVFSATEFLALPEGASIVVRFEERIVDGPGDDLQIIALNSAGEAAEVSVGATADALVPVGTIGESAGADGVDLAAHGVTGPIQFVRLRSLSSVGSIPGFDLVGFEAIHLAPPRAGAREVVIKGAETVGGVDFGRLFRDDPPRVFVEVATSRGGGVRSGEAATVRVSASDDVGGKGGPAVHQWRGRGAGCGGSSRLHPAAGRAGHADGGGRGYGRPGDAAELGPLCRHGRRCRAVRPIAPGARRDARRWRDAAPRVPRSRHGGGG